MLTQQAERILPYSHEQLFDLVADVERYPEFVPCWIAARIRKREAEVYFTDQVVGFGPVRVSFGSQTVLRRPERIDVISGEPPFRHFRLSWLFEPRAGASCRVSLIAELEFRSWLLERLVDKVVSVVVNDIIAAFVARAQQLYGGADRRSGNARSQ